MGESVNEVYGDFIVRRYANERAARLQLDAFHKWLKTNGIEGLGVWGVRDTKASYIVVFDISGRAGEFAWAGEEWDLRDEEMESFLARFQALHDAVGDSFRATYPESLAPRRGDDGRWVVPRPQG